MSQTLLNQTIIKRERLIKLALVAIIIISCTAILLLIPGMLISFLLAFVITYLFKPPVSQLERIGFGRTTSVAIPFIIGGILMAGLIQFVGPKISNQFSSLETEVPKYVKAVSELVERNTHSLTKITARFSKVDITAKVNGWLQELSTNFLTKVPEFLSVSISAILLAPLFAFFMLRDGGDVMKRLLALVPNNLFEMATNLSYQINKQLGGFIRARLLESIIVGFIVWVGLFSFSFPYSLFLAVVAGITNLIPYIGPLIGAAPALVVAMVNSPESPKTLYIVGAIYLLSQLLDMVFVIPLVVAKIVELHPVTVILAIIVGGQLMGILGMIISVPVASILKLTITEVYNHVVDIRD